MARVITASEPFWTAPFTGLSPRAFGKLVTVLRREGADAVRRGRPWSLPLENRALLVTAYWRTNLTMRQLARLFGVSKSTADRIIDRLGPVFALQPRKRFAKNTVLIGDGTLVPTPDHTVAERSKNYRYSTHHQVVIDADTRLVVVVGRPLAGNRNDCKAWEESGAKAAVGKTLTIADGGYRGTGLLIPHRRERGQTELPDWKENHHTSHKQVRAREADVRERLRERRYERMVTPNRAIHLFVGDIAAHSRTFMLLGPFHPERSVVAGGIQEGLFSLWTSRRTPPRTAAQTAVRLLPSRCHYVAQPVLTHGSWSRPATILLPRKPPPGRTGASGITSPVRRQARTPSGSPSSARRTGAVINHSE